MKKTTIALISILVLCAGACKKQERSMKNSEQANDNNAAYTIVKKFIQMSKQPLESRNKTSEWVPADSVLYYANVLSSAFITDCDSMLLDFVDSSYQLNLLPSSTNVMAFSSLCSQIISLKSSLQGWLDPNERMYSIKIDPSANQGTQIIRIMKGRMSFGLALGKAINPSTGMNYFAPGTNYRMGYGNERNFTPIGGGLPYVIGGRDPIENTPTMGNGLVLEAWGKYVWYGGASTNNLPTGSVGPAGAAKMLETYGNNNIFNTIGWPAAAPQGYKYVYTEISNDNLFDYKTTFIKDNPWYNSNQLTDRSTQLFPSVIMSKFCSGSESITNLTATANPTYSVWQPIQLTSNQLNYYLNKIPSIYYKARALDVNPNRVFYRLDIIPIYNPNEINCSNICYPEMLFSNTMQHFTPFDLTYFPDACVKLKYKYLYKFRFAKRTIVPDPNAYVPGF
jgi:hypothetical protein